MNWKKYRGKVSFITKWLLRQRLFKSEMNSHFVMCAPNG